MILLKTYTVSFHQALQCSRRKQHPIHSPLFTNHVFYYHPVNKYLCNNAFRAPLKYQPPTLPSSSP